jgi:hypothetical protein
LPFSEEELKAFIIMNRESPTELKDWCDDQMISQILSITGSVAIEINRFVNGFYNDIKQIDSAVKLQERFYIYDDLYRTQYSTTVLKEWYDKQGTQKEKALENIERFDL